MSMQDASSPGIAPRAGITPFGAGYPTVGVTSPDVGNLAVGKGFILFKPGDARHAAEGLDHRHRKERHGEDGSRGAHGAEHRAADDGRRWRRWRHPAES